MSHPNVMHRWYMKKNTEICTTYDNICHGHLRIQVEEFHDYSTDRTRTLLRQINNSGRLHITLGHSERK